MLPQIVLIKCFEIEINDFFFFTIPNTPTIKYIQYEKINGNKGNIH